MNPNCLINIQTMPKYFFFLFYINTSIYRTKAASAVIISQGSGASIWMAHWKQTNKTQIKFFIKKKKTKPPPAPPTPPTYSSYIKNQFVFPISFFFNEPFFFRPISFGIRGTCKMLFEVKNVLVSGFYKGSRYDWRLFHVFRMTRAATTGSWAFRTSRKNSVRFTSCNSP